MSGRPVELHIRELVLHGFAPGDRHRIAEGVRRELARLLAEEGASVAAGDAEARSLDGGAFSVRPGAGPGEVGARVAQAVYAGLRGSDRRGNDPAVRLRGPPPGADVK